MVLVDQPDEVPQPEPEPESSSSEPPPSVPAQNILEEILLKYGLRRQDNPPIVIANPISPSEPTSAPPPPPVVKFSRSRKKSFAKKGAGTSEPTVSEEEVSAGHTEPSELERTTLPGEASETQSST